MGQCAELMAAANGTIDLSKFTMDRYVSLSSPQWLCSHLLCSYEIVTKNKISIPTFYLPVALALLMCGFSFAPTATLPEDIFAQAKDILVQIGLYARAKSDYIAFVNSGKSGNLTGKHKNGLTWCIVKALEVTKDNESLRDLREVLMLNYGKNDAISEGRVREVFRKINLAPHFRDFEEDIRTKITDLIEQFPQKPAKIGGPTLKREIFWSLLRKVGQMSAH